MTTVLVSRFLLDLQASNQRALKLDSRDPLYLSDAQPQSQSLVFARVVLGSLGGSILRGVEDAESEHDEDSEESMTHEELEEWQ